MDALIASLNQAAIEKLNRTAPAPKPTGGEGGVSFQETLDKSWTDRLMEKMKEDYGMNQGQDMTVTAAPDIKVANSLEVDPSAKPNEEFFGTFKELNKDLLTLDSALETLTTPGLKINPRQLLALQAGIANTTIMAEGFSRFTDAIARGIQTVVQTQVG